MKSCGIICFVVLAAFVVESIAEPCTPGEKKNEDCNTCTCLASGEGYACTRMHCLKKRSECVEGEHKTEDCNHCNCVKGGVWACTRNICIEKRETHTLCVPNETFKKDCNTCTCSSDGNREACTDKACPKFN